MIHCRAQGGKGALDTQPELRRGMWAICPPSSSPPLCNPGTLCASLGSLEVPCAPGVAGEKLVTCSECLLFQALHSPRPSFLELHIGHPHSPWDNIHQSSSSIFFLSFSIHQLLLRAIPSSTFSQSDLLQAQALLNQLALAYNLFLQGWTPNESTLH